MKKSFSKLNLLNQELSDKRGTKSILNYFLPKRRYIKISVPYYEHLRGQYYIEDLRDTYGEEEVPYYFGLGELVYFLYDDFLRQVKMGVKNEQIADYLVTNHKHYFKPKKKTVVKKVMQPVTPNLLKFETFEEEEYISEEVDKMAYITIRLKESEILRGEILLYDLSEYMLNYENELTVEDTIAILYLDFIDIIKKDGNSKKTQQSILNAIKKWRKKWL